MNRSSLVLLNFEVLEKLWIGKDVSYSYLRDLRGKTFMHALKEQRSKFDDKAISHVFVWHNDEEFGFKLWDLIEDKSVRSRNLVFQEDQILKNPI